MKVEYGYDMRGKPRVLELSQALQPNPHLDHGTGQIESLERRVDELEWVVGQLAALLVETGVVSLDAAAKACNCNSWNGMKPIIEDNGLS